jgi:hypothetical protein
MGCPLQGGGEAQEIYFRQLSDPRPRGGPQARPGGAGRRGEGRGPAGAKQASRAAAKTAKRVTHDLVEKVVEDFIERYARPNTRDWQETARLLNKDVVPARRGRRLLEITRADVHALLDGIVDRGAPIGANRTFAQLRKMTKWALSRGIIDKNPCDGVEKPSAEKQRDRTLSDDELAAIWRAGKSMGFPYTAISIGSRGSCGGSAR